MIYDISQPVFECVVFPGDPGPVGERIYELEKGDVCNLTVFSMCAHNGTHVDAPYHFLEKGKKIGGIALEKFVGKAYVARAEGDVTADDAERILRVAAASVRGAEKRILIKGKATVSIGAARVFAEAGVDLIGNESQTVGPEEAPAEVHKVLLGADVVLLEGIRLGDVPEGAYLLNCAPLNLGDADGAPCRAVLVDL